MAATGSGFRPRTAGTGEFAPERPPRGSKAVVMIMTCPPPENNGPWRCGIRSCDFHRVREPGKWQILCSSVRRAFKNRRILARKQAMTDSKTDDRSYLRTEGNRRGSPHRTRFRLRCRSSATKRAIPMGRGPSQTRGQAPTCSSLLEAKKARGDSVKYIENNTND